MSNIEKVLYTGKTRVAGDGRDGRAHSDDGRLDLLLASPGARARGTNPEQLLGAGWGACYLGALRIVAKESKVELPEAAAVEIEVDLGLDGRGGYHLQARVKVALPGLQLELARSLAAEAHLICPYSKALHASTAAATKVVV